MRQHWFGCMRLRTLTLVLSFSMAWCMGQCGRLVQSNRKNLTMSIWLHRAHGQGLYDRYNIIHGLIRLANKTNSRVYFPPPCEMLGSQHNGGKSISCKLQWSDFLDMSKYANLLLTSKPSQQPDVMIYAYYKTCREWFLLGPAKPYELLVAAPAVRLAATQFIRKWLPGPFSYVHLRLGEDHQNCDQNQSAILNRLSDLSLKLEFRGQMIAFSSNILLSPDFLTQAGDVTNATAVWVDPIIRELPATISGNNYLVFNFETEIMKRAMYKIVWHRTYECGNVTCVAACKNVSA